MKKEAEGRPRAEYEWHEQVGQTVSLPGILGRLTVCPTFMFLFLLCLPVLAGDWTGKVAGETRVFPEEKPFSEQHTAYPGLSFQPRYFHAWEEKGQVFEFEPFLRLDLFDAQRTHADLRELYWRKKSQAWEVRAGVSRVTWGVIECRRLEDVINQQDLVEDFSGKEKLGQPMANFTWLPEWGTWDLYILPWFRPLRYPGTPGRPTAPLHVDAGKTIYESSLHEANPDVALRFERTMGDWDFGMSQFYGTSRETLLHLHWGDWTFGRDLKLGKLRHFIPLSRTVHVALVPYYEVMSQTGVDVQWTQGPWVLKGESIYRTAVEDPFVAATAGVERTFGKVFNSKVDVTGLLEYNFDQRDPRTRIMAMGNGPFMGARVALNDSHSTTIKAGTFVSPENGSTILALDAECTLGKNWRASLRGRFFENIPHKDLLSFFQRDDMIRAEVAWYF